MAKIIVLKIEIPADDDVRVDGVKGVVLGALRALGKRQSDPGEGQSTIEHATFFDAASVKFWTQPTAAEKKKPKTPV
jgi:hypothetical protein